MAKRFFETFPALILEDELKDLFEFAEVTALKYNRDRTAIHVYLLCRRLISKPQIYAVESKIEKQMFPDGDMKIRIFESFSLSEQYTPSYLVDVYKDSLFAEIKRRSDLDYHILMRADWKVADDNSLLLTLEDSLWARNRAGELREWIQMVFYDRCAISIPVAVSFKERDTTAIEEEKKRAEAQAIARIMKANSVASKEKEDEFIDTASADTKKGSEKTTLRKGDPSKAAKSAGEKNVQTPREIPGGNFQKSSYNKGNKGGYSAKRPLRSDDPNMVYGRNFDDVTPMKIVEIQEEIGEVVINGKIIAVTERELRNGEKTIISFAVTDYTDTIMAKIFVPNEFLAELKKDVAVGKAVTVKGIAMMDKFDHEVTISSVSGIKRAEWKEEKREDHALVKRVELHCHTKSSEMDAVSDAQALVKTAKGWGHTALAITDHGCAYAFPEAAHALSKGDDFKLIFGCEGYLVDDLKEIVVNSNGASLDASYVVFDIETTGFHPSKNKIIEIGAVKVINGEITDRFSEFINPRVPIPFTIERLTGINDAMVCDAPGVEEILPKFLSFCEGCVLVAHNASFDTSFIRYNAEQLGIEFPPTYVDTVGLARFLLPHLGRFKLDTVAKELHVSLENHHRAVDDAGATAEIFVKFLPMLKKKGFETLDDIVEKAVMTPEAIMRMPTYHIILLAANEVGRINLYRLISMAHVKYFARRPRFPRSEIMKYREGLIIGSACEAGELFRAITGGESDDEIAKIVSFYDYLEIQPTGNNEFMLREEGSPYKTREDLEALNKKIVQLGELYDKPVCATCDVHFLNPEDEVYRRIIMSGKGFKDADFQPPLYYRTTEEMLKEFEYLGSDKAYEVVVTNTNLIADRIDHLAPVRPDKCPPVIENSDIDLRNMCYEKAHSMYGDPLPPIVEERLEHELHSIISNGFAVMYLIAVKLVHKSNEDGYMVGSRGSVGSSFVATMSGITEVNPLSPHYYCKKCHYSDFDSEEVKKFGGGAGCDMPDKICPVCGEKLAKDGYDIPFETFLGFYGDKEPDIDLNFSGEYQSKAHAYTEVIFGAGQTFRAGTVGTLAEKTAFGYVKNYYEEHNQHKRECEINRLVTGCTGVKRTSGQHPGGIIVLPIGEDINSFTPVQHPANDMTTSTVTTHFDYHSIDHNLLKLDILGHDDPTMIRMLEDLTGIDAREIPLDSPEVMSLFKDTSALGIKPEDIGGCKLGALGLPEFGTDFAMGMLIETQPQHFSDLVRIAGLSHGTDVWLGNAQTLLQEKKATISTAICTRDDIMVYLISKGIEKGLSFKIMEAVRKGKGLQPEWEQTMVEHDVPDWYIWSCKKIKYMFPKAHAAAYVMMMWRIAYCKIFYPLAFYAAYFSIRATAFSYELMCQGKEVLERHMADYESRMDTLSPKEKDSYHDMRIVQEMYVRGFEFTPIDLFKVQATRFQIVDGKLMPSLSSIEGLGNKAAESIVEAALGGAFLSRQDFRERAKVGQTVSDKLLELGILSDIPESNQLSLFDF